MRIGVLTAALSAMALAGCASGGHGGMGHDAMSHEDMMRHCQMMEQHQSEGSQGSAEHDPAQHGGTSHEDMMRHCAQMRDQPTVAPGASASAERQQAVAEAGAHVMPFDLERTTHTFTDEPWGGSQLVVSDDGDAEQVALIRSHLSAEAAKFARGDFASPEAIHGPEMPGLDVLRVRHSSVEVSYADISGGGTITYRSQDRASIEAIHAWFQAQRSDHGAHAAH
jgi:hypothetical protein